MEINTTIRKIWRLPLKLTEMIHTTSLGSFINSCPHKKWHGDRNRTSNISSNWEIMRTCTLCLSPFFSKGGGPWSTTSLEINSIGQVLERPGGLQLILYFFCEIRSFNQRNIITTGLLYRLPNNGLTKA